MFSGGYAPFCVCWLNINFKLTCLREHMHFVKILQKGGKKKNMHIVKWSSNESHCCLLLYCRGLYVSSSLHFSINPSISVGRKFALDVHLLSGLFLLFVCFIGVYDTYENYYFLALQFLRVWSPKWNHDFNCHRAENKPMFSPQHLFQNKIC